MRNILSAITVLMLVASAQAATYKRVNMTVHRTVDLANAYVDGGNADLHSTLTIWATRPAGEDPNLQLTVTYEIHGDGTMTNSYVWGNTHMIIGPDSFLAEQPGYTWDARDGYTRSENATKVPGVYTISLVAWIHNSSNLLRNQPSIDLSEANLLDETPSEGGTGGLTDEDKGWFQSWFTMSDTEKGKWTDVKTALYNWGPIQYYFGVTGELSGAKDVDISADHPMIGTGAFGYNILHPPDMDPYMSAPYQLVQMDFKVKEGTYRWAGQNQGGEEALFQGQWGSTWAEVIPYIRGILAAFVYVLWGLMFYRRLLPIIVKAM